MAHPIHKHMHTHITKQNVKAAIRDDKAHMDYLKRDVKDDQRAGGKYKDINQTADEKHISKLAGDVKYDEKKEGMSRESSYEQAKNLMKYNPVDDRAGISRYEEKGMSRHTSKHAEEEYMDRKDAAIKKSKGKDGVSRKSKTTKNKTVKVGNSTIEVDEKGKFGKVAKKERPKKKDGMKEGGKGKGPKDPKVYGSGFNRKTSTGKEGMSKKKMEEMGRTIRTASGKATKKDKRKNKRDFNKTMRHVRKHGSGLKMD